LAYPQAPVRHIRIYRAADRVIGLSVTRNYRASPDQEIDT